MDGVRVNHVSIVSDDFERSIRWYEELFGAERLPSPDFPEAPVKWLRLGASQLHLFQRDIAPPTYHHLALDVPDFNEVYRRAQALGALDPKTFDGAVREHPAGWVQLYLRDPSGNLVEVDARSEDVDRSLVTEIVPLTGQEGEAARASLYA